MIDLSIIIPVFNGEKYIARCLNSIFESGLDTARFEVIVVNDCSTDQSQDILDSWKSKYSNIRSFSHTVNRKQGTARNTGLNQARGEYIYFVDIDDTILNGFTEALAYAMDNHIDILHTKISVQDKSSDTLSTIALDCPSKTIMSGHNFCEDYYQVWPCSVPWASFFKRAFLSRINYMFVEDKLHEDADWVEYVFTRAETIAYADIVTYRYFLNEGSTMRTFNWQKDINALEMIERRFVQIFNDDTHPRFNSRIFAHNCQWTNSVLSLRHLSRHKFHYARKIINYASHCNPLSTIGPRDLNVFAFLCTHFPEIASVVLFFVRPVTNAIRKI